LIGATTGKEYRQTMPEVKAETSGSRFIITGNTGDFTHSPVPAITPVEFLSQFSTL